MAHHVTLEVDIYLSLRDDMTGVSLHVKLLMEMLNRSVVVDSVAHDKSCPSDCIDNAPVACACYYSEAVKVSPPPILSHWMIS